MKPFDIPALTIGDSPAQGGLRHQASREDLRKQGSQAQISRQESKGEIRKQDSKLSDFFGFGKSLFGSSPSPPEAAPPKELVRAKSTKQRKPVAPERVLPRRIYTEDWDTKPPCAVIVTIHSNGSYDRLFREVPQRSPDSECSIALFEMSYDTMAPFYNYLASDGMVGEESSNSAIRDVLDAIAQVSSESVLFNFECCSYCARKDFKSIKVTLNQFVRAMIVRGYMLMFSDFSLKSMIANWDSNMLGPCPLHHIGKCEERIELSFDSNTLRNCSSSQLRTVGALSDDTGKATIKCMGNNIIYTLREARVLEHAPYSVEVLSIATDFGKFWTLDPRQHKMRKLYLNTEVGYAGHVMITYPASRGRILASAGHWIDLMKVEAKPKQVLEVVTRVYGEDFAEEVKQELQHAPSEETAREIVQRSVRQIVLSSAPCSYSLRSPKHNRHSSTRASVQLLQQQLPNSTHQSGYSLYHNSFSGQLLSDDKPSPSHRLISLRESLPAVIQEEQLFTPGSLPEDILEGEENYDG